MPLKHFSCFCVLQGLFSITGRVRQGLFLLDVNDGHGLVWFFYYLGMFYEVCLSFYKSYKERSPTQEKQLLSKTCDTFCLSYVVFYLHVIVLSVFVTWFSLIYWNMLPCVVGLKKLEKNVDILIVADLMCRVFGKKGKVPVLKRQIAPVVIYSYTVMHHFAHTVV